MSDVTLYDSETGSYDQIQNSRPDYVAATDRVVKFASEHLASGASVADFCCGTGIVTKRIAERIGGLGKAVLIDVNEEFLKIARDSGILAQDIQTKCSDILAVDPGTDADCVVSAFAYHHVPDADKLAYIQQVRRALKQGGGMLILAEIYSPDRQTTISYYEHLFAAVPAEKQTPELKKFLQETARSELFEFKVAKEFADQQLRDSGFALIESAKIWPNDGTEVGTFVEVWRL